MGAITDLSNRKTFRSVEWNPDLLSRARRRVLTWLTMRPSNLEDLASHACLDIGNVARLVNRMCSEAPPLVNRVGDTDLYQLSVEGRKMMRVSDAPAPTPAPRIIHIDPGPRGQLVKILKEKPAGIAEMMKATGLNYQQVYYTLKTLEERGLMGERVRSGRELRYRLKTTPDVEPPKPMLTPSVVALCDEGDWHTWYERLLLHKLGGPEVILEDVNDDRFIQKKTEKQNLPKILIVGANFGTKPMIEKQFSNKFNLNFFDDKFGSAGLQARCRQVDHVFLCTARARHSHQYAIRNVGTPLTLVSGNHTRLCDALERFNP